MIQNLIYKIIKKSRWFGLQKSCIHNTSKAESGSFLYNSTMDRYSFCGYDCEIMNTTIGSFCSIANSVIIGGGAHPIEWVSTSPVFYAGRDSVRAKFSEFERTPVLQTIIGNDVWIGQNSLIKQGVLVGDGAVIGMGSVVTKNIPPYAIVAGNPAKILRYRFDMEMCNLLLESKWWEMSDDILLEISQNIRNPKEFISQLNSKKGNM